MSPTDGRTMQMAKRPLLSVIVSMVGLCTTQVSKHIFNPHWCTKDKVHLLARLMNLNESNRSLKAKSINPLVEHKVQKGLE